MKIIDLNSWPRKSLYDHFRSLASPHFAVTADVDVTGLIRDAKPRGVSVFSATLFAVMTACNRLPEFRQRLKGDEVIEFDVVHPAPTVPLEGDLFGFCSFDFAPVWEEFNTLCLDAMEVGKCQTELEDDADTRDDLIFTTCLPWIHFTSLHHPVSGPDDSFPRVAWGKFTQRHDRWLMPVNVQLHHALADGIHVGKFYQYMQEVLDGFGD